MEQFFAKWLNIVGKSGYPKCVDPLYKLSWEIDDNRVKTDRNRLLVVCNFVYHLLKSGVRSPWVKPSPGNPGSKGFGPIGVYTALLSLENAERLEHIIAAIRKYQVSTFFKLGSMMCTVSGRKSSTLTVTINMSPRTNVGGDLAKLKGFLYNDTLPPELEDKSKVIGTRKVSKLPFPKMLMATQSDVSFHTLEVNPRIMVARSKTSLVFRFAFEIPFDIADWAPKQVQQKMLKETFLKLWRTYK